MHVVSVLLPPLTVPSISSFVKRVLLCNGPLFSLTSTGNFPHLTVLPKFSCNCTHCLCRHSFQGFVYGAFLSFLTILIQTNWSSEGHFSFGAIRVNYASVSNMYMLNIQNMEFPVLSLISGC